MTTSSLKIQQQILDDWSNCIDKNICVGLSGGVDSIVLLHVLKNITAIKQLNLSAIHINHHISKNSDNWAIFCQNFCNQLNVPLQVIDVTVNKNGGESLENNARLMRYNAFYKHNAPVITLAHHQNDQVETTLSQIFRGSDVHNVAAMKVLSYKYDKLFWRPLLNTTRVEIEEYAKKYNLTYVNDESNSDTTYLRNFIRHDVLPILNNWDANITQKILSFNKQLQNLLIITDEIADNDLIQVSNTDGDIVLDKFIKFSNERQQNLLTKFIQNNKIQLPSQKKLAEFIRQALTSNWDTKPALLLPNSSRLIKYKQIIFIETF